MSHNNTQRTSVVNTFFGEVSSIFPSVMWKTPSVFIVKVATTLHDSVITTPVSVRSHCVVDI